MAPGTAASVVPDLSTESSAPTPAPTPAPALTCLKSLPFDALAAWVASTGEPPAAVPARTLQLWRLLYYRDTKTGVGLVSDLAAQAGPGVQGGLSGAFLARVAAASAAGPGAAVDPGIALESIHTSADGTRKLVFRVTAGPAAGRGVDAVLIPVLRRAGARPRLTLCLSSQAGCSQGCTFCLTGAMGLGGSLTAGQIVEQAVVARRLLAAEAAEAEAAAAAAAAGGEEGRARQRGRASAGRSPGAPPPLTNIVFMGQGEPFDNLAAVTDAVSILTHPLGLAFGPSKVTVSTVGLLGPLRSFAASHRRAQVALSLHATTDAGRAAIMPAAARPGHDLAAVAACLREVFPNTGRGSNEGNDGGGGAPGGREGGDDSEGGGRGGGSGHRRHVLVEYLLLDGVNDSPADAARLLALLEGVAAKINLLNFNPHEAAVFGRSGRGDAFRAALVAGGRVCTVRASRGGDDAMAACGQLGDPGAAGGVVAKARLARLGKGGV
jgi:23S rRNA (adenine2503-C2)-methyltransferase